MKAYLWAVEQEGLWAVEQEGGPPWPDTTTYTTQLYKRYQNTLTSNTSKRHGVPRYKNANQLHKHYRRNRRWGQMCSIDAVHSAAVSTQWRVVFSAHITQSWTMWYQVRMLFGVQGIVRVYLICSMVVMTIFCWMASCFIQTPPTADIKASTWLQHTNHQSESGSSTMKIVTTE